LEKEYDILKHELVPEHVILKEEERKKLLEELNILPQQLPKILVTDPVVKAIEAKEGDVIKIIRKSPTAGRANYYRLVTRK
jgi:DNA-directed RNA polymerase subunit H